MLPCVNLDSHLFSLPTDPPGGTCDSSTAYSEDHGSASAVDDTFNCVATDDPPGGSCPSSTALLEGGVSVASPADDTQGP